MSQTEYKDKWKMPEWMEKYRDMISVGDERKNSTTSVEDLMNDDKTNPFNNSIRWSMILVVQTKVQLLEKLKEDGVIN